MAMTLLLAVFTTATAWAAYSPEGLIEVCRGGLHSIYVKGYAYDPDDITMSVRFQVKVFTDAECKHLYTETPAEYASEDRPDLGFQNGGGSPAKGFETTIDIADAGTYYVQVIALDWRGGDANSQLGLYGVSNKTVCITLRNPITTTQTLTSTTGSIYIGTGCVLTGTGGEDTQVTIAEGATVTLSGATITSIYNHKWAGITCEGDATIILAEGTTNYLKGGHQYYPGIYIPEGFTLTIRGNGSLDASSGSGMSQYFGEQSLAAGIGGGYYGDAGLFLTCGNIVIEGGTITATGGVKAAGIGGGDRGCGHITIKGGNITATGGMYGAGIGGGFGYNGNITITGGTINATGGRWGAGIGGSKNNACGNITISADVTSVTATAGTDAPNSIGNGAEGFCGTVSLGGAVTGSIAQSTFTFTPSQDMRSVSFDANGGTGTMADQPFVASLPISLNACSFTRAGYTFIGWDTQAEGGGVAYTDGQSIAITTDMTLYAQWQKNPIVTFDANGGEGTMSPQEFVTEKSQDLNACSFTRSGYAFVRWTTNADGSGDAYTDRQRIAISADMTLYAQWGEIHTISFESNGGSGTMAEQQFIEGVAQSLNACSFIFPEHKSFDKWTTQADGGGTSYADKQSIDINTDLTLYAQWVGSPIVTFNANGGTGSMADQEFTAGITQSLNANTFTREGHVFIGWSTNPEGGGDTYTNKQDIVINSDITLYAQWLQHTATTVTLSSSSGDVMLYDGDVLTGTGGTNTRVSIADGSTVTFQNANVTSCIGSYNELCRGSIFCKGDATIILAEGTNNEVKGTRYYPGIYVPKKRTLTIRGDGALTVAAYMMNNTYMETAAIGSGSKESCGNITIAGGNITATGGIYSAAIGSGHEASCGNITITGGTITATGGSNSAAIGSGWKASCDNITITGGTITATGGSHSAAIGGGYEASCGNITIAGGNIGATSGSDAAAIGSGYSGTCGNILLTGGATTATITNSQVGACIGCGYFGSCGDITISGGVTSVTTQKKTNNQAFIGKSESDTKATCGTLTICSLLSDVTNDNTKTRTISGGPVLELMDNDDHGDILALSVLGGTTYNTLKLKDRTLYRDGDWNTLCLPFDVTIAGSPLDGADVRELSSGSLEGGTLTLNFTEKNAVTAIEAGKPYLIKWGTTPDLVISSAAQWNLFALNVNNGTESYEGKLVKLGADIDGISTMVGTSEHKFKGIFDGDGHTLDLAIVGTAQCTAPFSYVEGATIKNLRTTGFVTFSVTGSNVYHASGLVGGATGVTIENCRVSMNIQFPDGTELVHSGGLIGHSGANPFTMTNCLFDGSIGYVDGGSGSMTNVGGLVGWGDNSTPNISNCLNAGNFVNPAGIAMIARGDNRGSITNCYSTTNASSNGQRYIEAGTYTTATGSDLLALLGDGWEMSGDEVVPKKSTIVLSDITDPVFANVTVTSAAPVPVTFTGGQFVGTYANTTFTSENRSILFLGAENKLYYPKPGPDPNDANVTLYPHIGAFRAYFQLNDASASVKEFRLIFGEEDKADGIGAIDNEDSSSQSSGADGTEFKIQNEDDAWYDLSGRKLGGKPTKSGLYIHNGKKVLK